MSFKKGVSRGRGDPNAISDRSGFKHKMSEMVIEPGTGWLVHKNESDGYYSAVEHPLNNIDKFLKGKHGDPFPVKNVREEVKIDATIKHELTGTTSGSAYLIGYPVYA